MFSGNCSFFGIFAMTLYCRIISNVLTMELTTSVSVSDKAQKNLGESTDPIGKTDQYRLWYNIGKGACLKWEDVALVVGLYKVQIGHVEQTLGRGHFPDSLKDAVKGAPNCMDYGEISMSVVYLTMDIPLLSFADILVTRRGQR